MKLFGLCILALIAACSSCSDSSGPSTGRDYCVDSVYYHLEQPAYQHTRDWIQTTENTFKITLVGDTTGTFSTSGSVKGLIRASFASDVDTVLVQFVSGATTGDWIVVNGRLLFVFRSGYEPFLGDPEVYHSRPADNKFGSLWEYSDADNNYARLNVWWDRCN